MEKIMILNASPRANVSNSKLYAQVFKNNFKKPFCEIELISTEITDIIRKIGDCSDLLIVFPLYVDTLPVALMEFLYDLEKVEKDLTVHILINCGFYEPEQNDIAVMVLENFCEKNGFKLSSVLKIGCGEAFMKTPLAFLAKRKIKSLAKAVENNKIYNAQVTMPIPKNMYLKASTKYWVKYGKKYGCSKEQMEVIEI